MVVKLPIDGVRVKARCHEILSDIWAGLRNANAVLCAVSHKEREVVDLDVLPRACGGRRGISLERAVNDLLDGIIVLHVASVGSRSSEIAPSDDVIRKGIIQGYALVGDNRRVNVNYLVHVFLKDILRHVGCRAVADAYTRVGRRIAFHDDGQQFDYRLGNDERNSIIIDKVLLGSRFRRNPLRNLPSELHHVRDIGRNGRNIILHSSEVHNALRAVRARFFVRSAERRKRNHEAVVFSEFDFWNGMDIVPRFDQNLPQVLLRVEVLDDLRVGKRVDIVRVNIERQIACEFSACVARVDVADANTAFLRKDNAVRDRFRNEVKRRVRNGRLVEKGSSAFGVCLERHCHGRLDRFYGTHCARFEKSDGRRPDNGCSRGDCLRCRIP